MKIEVNETAFNVEGRRSKIGPKCQFWGNNLEMGKREKPARRQVLVRK